MKMKLWKRFKKFLLDKQKIIYEIKWIHTSPNLKVRIYILNGIEISSMIVFIDNYFLMLLLNNVYSF